MRSYECDNFCNECSIEKCENRTEDFDTDQDYIVVTNKETGKKSICDVNVFCNLIKTVFPDREDQKELLQNIFQSE